MAGFVKAYREIMDKPIFDNEKLFKVFMWCVFKASHKKHKIMVGRQDIELEVGQFVFGRKQAAIELNMKESTVYDLMKWLETNSTINIKSNNKYSVVTIENYWFYQGKEEETNSNSNNKSTTNRQQIDTNKNVKNVKKGKKEELNNILSDSIYEIVEYLNNKTGSSFRATTKSTKESINARLKEGATVEDFKTVIDYKINEWKGTKYEKYLQPSTLFNPTKFEKYINQVKRDYSSKTKQQNNVSPEMDEYFALIEGR